MLRAAILAALIAVTPFLSFASGKPAGVGNADHVDAWHGTGDDHQANNNPGDTAADRHNFGDAAAGNSDQNPTAGSAQDDFSE